MNIHITTHGSSGQPLVFFHGWGFDSLIWDPLLPDLVSNYQLYLVDLPGFGLTPPMDWQSFKILLLNQLPDSFALLGWSMGGMWATRLAIEAPQRVSHLLNIASSPRFLKDIDWPGVDECVLATFYHNLTKSPAQTVAQFTALQLRGVIVPALKNMQLPSLAGLRAGLDVLACWDLRQQLNDINKPVCYMFGRLDSIIPRAVMPVMEKKYPHFDYVLYPHAAHIPFLSHSRQFMASLQNFLA